MSLITSLSIKNYRGIKSLSHDFGSERFVILIGRGDSGKSSLLSAIFSVLSPSWNLTFSDLDFYNQNTNVPIEIEASIKELPKELLKDSKFGLYIQNDLNDDCEDKDLTIKLILSVDNSLEPKWVVKARDNSDLEDKTISASDRALLAVNFISDYTDNQFSYNKRSPLYSLTKDALDDGTTIELVKSQLIRSMTLSVEKNILQPLNAPLIALKQTAEELGINITNLSAQIDIKENPYTGSSIALHDNNLPYRLHGKGSKRLMSIAIQSELTKQGGIVLVDELEQGLEPDRIITLTRVLKETTSGQVFITTHSLNVILEASWNNLFVLNKGANSIFTPQESLDSCRRSNPQAFFAKKIICCEGKTEQGFIRAMDRWIWEKYHTTLSANGVVTVNAGGGDKMYTSAVELKNLGYDTCVFADNDKYTELENKIKVALETEVSVFLCEKENCFERQLLSDLPWSHFVEITTCTAEGFPSNNIKISNNLRDKINKAQDETEQNKIKETIIGLSITKHGEWFKHIPGGEFLGKVFFRAFDDVEDDKKSKHTVVQLLNWCGVNK